MNCNYSYDLWCLAASKCNIQPLRSWTALLAQMTSLVSSRSSKLLTLLVWKSVMYWIWHERNQRLHASAFRNPDSLFKTIDLQIRNRIQSFRETSPTIASLMLQQWIAWSLPVILSPLWFLSFSSITRETHEKKKEYLGQDGALNHGLFSYHLGWFHLRFFLSCVCFGLCP